MQRALPQSVSDNIVLTCLADFRKYYADHCTQNTCVYEGIPGLLHGFIKRGLKIAVLTNKPQFHAEKCIKKYLDTCAIEIIIGQGNKDNLPAKPNPAGALKIAQVFNIPPEEILYLGDTAIDMKTAVVAGMTPVGVAWGFRPVKELQGSGAQHIVEIPSEILHLLD